jgi:hypothetical protein
MPYRIKEFEEVFVKRDAARRIKRNGVQWVSVPTRCDGMKYRRLIRQEGGLKAYGAFVCLVRVAANMPVRGLLADSSGEGIPLEDLASMIGIHKSDLGEAIDLLSSSEINWLEEVSGQTADKRRTNGGQTAESVRTTEQDKTEQDNTPYQNNTDLNEIQKFIESRRRENELAERQAEQDRESASRRLAI